MSRLGGAINDTDEEYTDGGAINDTDVELIISGVINDTNAEPITSETINNTNVEPTTYKANNDINVEPTTGGANNDTDAGVDISRSDELGEVINNIDKELNIGKLNGVDKIAKKEAKVCESNLI